MSRSDRRPHRRCARGALGVELGLFLGVLLSRVRVHHDRIINVAGLIHVDLATLIAEHSRVPQVLARRGDAVDNGLCQF